MRHKRQESIKKRGQSEQSKVEKSANEAGEGSKVGGGCGGGIGNEERGRERATGMEQAGSSDDSVR